MPSLTDSSIHCPIRVASLLRAVSGVVLALSLSAVSFARVSGPTPATVTLEDLFHTWDGSPKTPTVATTPSGLSVSITYDNSSTAPREVGTYNVVATITDPSYTGSTTGTMQINRTGQIVTLNDPGPVRLNTPITLSASATSGLPVAFFIASGTATIDGNVLVVTAPQPVTIAVSQVGNTHYTPAATERTIAIDPASINRLANLSSRAPALIDANDELVLGFVIEGSTSKPVLLRAIGPGLVDFGVTDAMADPQIEVFDANSNSVATNDNWAGDTNVSTVSQAIGAFPLTSSSNDAAMVLSLAPGSYTAHVKGGAGQVLAEVFDATTTPQIETRLLNISTRANVRPGEPLIGGIVVAGDIPETVLIRGVGPTLGTFGRTSVLLNPVLTVFDAAGNVIATNTDWHTPTNPSAPSASQIESTAQTVGAFALPPGSDDASILISLSPGVYTVHLASPNSSGGEALLEIYEVTPTS